MNPVVVAFGQHEHANDALRWAAEVASLVGAPLQVVTVYEPTYAELRPDWFKALADERRLDIERVLAEVDHVDADIVILLSAEPFHAIAGHLKTHDAFLSVIGSQDSHLPGGLGSGFPAHQLLHATHVPVAVVRPGYEAMAGGHIVVGVDGTGANSAALRLAAKLAEAAGAELHAVFAYDPLDDTFSHADGWHRHSDDVRAEVGKVMSVPVKLYMSAGHPAEVLIDHARREHSALIVTGTRGRGGFDALILGRVPGQLIAHAECPLLVVPS